MVLVFGCFWAGFSGPVILPSPRKARTPLAVRPTSGVEVMRQGGSGRRDAENLSKLHGLRCLTSDPAEVAIICLS
jgi:hypothetical protein